LTWAAPGSAGRGDNPAEGRVHLHPRGGPEGGFTAEDARLKPAGDAPSFADGERRASVVVGGESHAVVFPPFERRQMDLRPTADWVVRPRLLKVSGLAQVMVMGGGRKQYQVLVDPNALLEYDVTLRQVEDAVRKNNVNASGGFAVRGDKERPIRVLGRLGPEP